MEKVKINIVPKGLKPACYVSQNDNGRVVRFELFDELTPYTLDGSETITITVVRPDGVELVSSVVNTEDSYIDVVFNDDMTAIAGIADCELTITDGETVIGSRNFDMNIEIDAYNGKDIVIETATGVIASFNTEVEDNALEYESEIPYNAEGYTGLEIINSRTAPAYDKTPYLFRKTPSGYGNSCIEKLNGLSVAFNQLILDETGSGTIGGVTYTKNNDGSYTVTGTPTDNNNFRNINYTANENKCRLLSNHVYLMPKANSYNGTIGLGCFGDSLNFYSIERDIIFKVNNTVSQSWLRIQISQLQNVNIGTVKIYPQLFDLTQMLGSELADYLYTLETQTAGAGVSLFKSLGFDKPYYPYNAGELMSSKPTSKKVVGFNQWSEEWSNGYYDANGVFFNNSNYVASKYKFNILPNTSYTITSLSKNIGRLCFYDKLGNFISSIVGIGSLISYTFTSPDNAYLFAFDMVSAYGNTYKNDICVNISDPARNGQYEPYNAVTYPLDPDLELRGIPKLDANNKIYADGDIYESNGAVTRRYGIVDLGSLSYTLYTVTEGNLFRARIDEGYLPANTLKLVCAKYITTTSNGRSNKTISVGSVGRIDIIDDDYSDKDAFKTAMNGVYLVYELATPTSESADPYTDPQEARITEEFIDERSIPIPVGHDTIYVTDIEYQDIDFDTTIFGGDINAIDGVLTSRYNSDGSVKTTPDVIELDPALIPVKAGDNNIFNSASGAQTIRYYNQED